MVAKAPPARLLIPAQRRPSRERLLAAEPFFLRDLAQVPAEARPRILSFETDGTNFGDRQGSWLGLNAAPTYVAFSEDAYPLTLSLPLALGLSLSEYYELPGQGDDTFGFFSVGFSTSVPLAFIPADYGAWSAYAGVNVFVLGDNLEEANLGDSPFAVGTGGIRFDY